MFDRPDRSEFSELRREHYSDWINRFRQSDTTVFGSGPCALITAIVLRERNVDTVILQESEQLGGRYFWEPGPVTLLSPADELLEELGVAIEESPPFWIDRVTLYQQLLHRFYQLGGVLVTGVYPEEFPHGRGDLELPVRIRDQREVLTTNDIVLSEPVIEPPFEDKPSEEPMETMVLNTGRSPEGWVIAGYQALPESDRDRDYPFENSACLSGRKAAELILSDE